MQRYHLLICLVIVLSSKPVKLESSSGIGSSTEQGLGIGQGSDSGQESVIGQESVTGQESVFGQEPVIGQESVPGQKSVPSQKPQNVDTKYIQAINAWMFDIFLLCLKWYFVLGVLLLSIYKLAIPKIGADIISDFVMFKIVGYTLVIFMGISLIVGVVLLVLAYAPLSRVWPYFATYIVTRRNHPHECILITLFVHWYYGASLFYLSVWYIYYWVCICVWHFLRGLYTEVARVHTEDQFKDEVERLAWENLHNSQRT